MRARYAPRYVCSSLNASLVIQITNLEVPVDGINILVEHDDVLDLRSSKALQTDRDGTRYERFTDDGEQWAVTCPEYRGDVDFDDYAETILAKGGIITNLRKCELPGQSCLPRPSAVKEKWI